eukprot:6412069-Amphidinium_carterae.1
MSYELEAGTSEELKESRSFNLCTDLRLLRLYGDWWPLLSDFSPRTRTLQCRPNRIFLQQHLRAK